MGHLTRKYSSERLKALQLLIFAEEDRIKFTTQKWTSGFRWFRNPDVICLEHFSRKKSLPMALNNTKPAA
jgi:hypothetical protein